MLRPALMDTTTAPPPATWAPLRHRAFRALFIAATASNLGAWMQDVGRSWLMLQLSPSPLLIALVQSTAMAGVFVFALPAGAVADLLDRRRVLILAQGWMLVVAALLAAVTAAGAMTPALLLVLTFAGAAGTAFTGPAWQAALPDLVGDRDVPAAITLNSLSFNATRAVGPALGGALVGAMGPAAAFALNAAAFAAVIAAVIAWHPPPRPARTAPLEHGAAAILAGLRYAREDRGLRGVLIRSLLFTLPASAVWALLPLAAARGADAGPSAYGALLGAMGAGAIAAAPLLGQLRARLGPRRILLLGAGLFALAGPALAAPLPLPARLAVLALAGAGWMMVNAGLAVATQQATPPWVRARAISLFILVFSAGMAVGGIAWGQTAAMAGLTPILAAAGALQVFGALASLALPLPEGDVGRTTVVDKPWPEPTLALTPDLEHGPVLVTVEYRCAPGRRAAALDLLRALGPGRRATGTLVWSAYTDATDCDLLAEANTLASWADHLRQRERITAADAALERQLGTLLAAPPRVRHWLPPEPAPTPVARNWHLFPRH